MCVILGRMMASCRRAPRPASHGKRYDDGALESVLSPFHDAPAQEGVELRDLTAASAHPSRSTAGETEESEEQPLVVHSPGQTPSPDVGHAGHAEHAVQAAAGDGVLAVGDWAQAQVQVSHRPGFMPARFLTARDTLAASSYQPRCFSACLTQAREHAGCARFGCARGVALLGDRRVPLSPNLPPYPRSHPVSFQRRPVGWHLHVFFP